jgi:hypothetical protein
LGLILFSFVEVTEWVIVGFVKLGFMLTKIGTHYGFVAVLWDEFYGFLG